MANRRSRQYELKKIELEVVNSGGGSNAYDIKDIVADFEYIESIESPFVRCDFTIVDSVDFNKTLQGGEIINIDVVTDSAKGKHLKMKLKVFKIGSIIKSERGQMYILHCASPEIYNNEMSKVFKSFGPMGGGAKNISNIPKHLCEKYWGDDAKSRIKGNNFESHSTINFISPNWKVTDAISYLSDKVVRQKGGKSSTKQSGYLFFENRDGYVFYSVDGLCEGAIKGAENFTYILQQQGADPADDGMYSIESVQYPDKADHLRNMRLGTYKSMLIGISLPIPTNSKLTDSGNNDKRGSITQPKIIDFNQVFGMASTIEKTPPYEVPADIRDAGPTRMHIRALPDMKNQRGSGPANAGTTSNEDTSQVGLYASARYSLLKSVQLTIVVPGNTALMAGQLIKVRIPASEQSSGNNAKVKEDRKYSGKYIIAAVSHTYKREGLTSKLTLMRDSIKKASY